MTDTYTKNVLWHGGNVGRIIANSPDDLEKGMRAALEQFPGATFEDDAPRDEMSQAPDDTASDEDEPSMENILSAIVGLTSVIEDVKTPDLPTKVIYSGPMTVAVWSDNKKTRSRHAKTDSTPYDGEFALMLVLLKHYARSTYWDMHAIVTSYDMALDDEKKLARLALETVIGKPTLKALLKRWPAPELPFDIIDEASNLESPIPAPPETDQVFATTEFTYHPTHN